MNPSPFANMQQLVSHWKTLQSTTTSSKKRRRSSESQSPRTRVKTLNGEHSNVNNSPAHEIQAIPAQNLSFSS